MSEIRKAYEFIKECSCFYVLTVNGNVPAGRPFTGIMEDGDKIFIATNDRNEAHKQMRENENIQILAKKDDAFHWVRVSGKAKECNDFAVKEKMLDEVPMLRNMHGSADSEHYLVFEVLVSLVEFK